MEEENESKYRERLQRTENLIVAFFERHDEFPDALEDIRRQLVARKAEPDKGCILYRTRCGADVTPKLRVWSQLVPFEELTLPEVPRPPWVGLNRHLNRPMNDQECVEFLESRLYEVFEIRVSRRAV